MDPIEGKQIFGQFMHPLIDQTTENDDPWQRNYYQPPQLNRLVPRAFPLLDIWPSISDPKYAPADLLKSHGFGVVKHSSALLESPYAHEDLSEQIVVEVYFPEIQDLVIKTTGAKHMFIMASIIRRGTRVPEVYKLPTAVNIAAAINNRNQSKDKEVKPAEETRGGKSMDRLHVPMAAPVRIPRLDFTPLGARQTIQFQTPDIYNTAVESGVIAAEDKICQNHSLLAVSKEADPFIAGQYNQNGKLGPRYAAYSVWRPLKKVGRDPLALAPRRTSTSTNGDTVYWPYENKIPGSSELGGDFLKEYAMLGVQGESPVSNTSNFLQWYYLSAQEPDEVLVIKFFDSAALGKDAEEADAPWHASPEIGAGG